MKIFLLITLAFSITFLTGCMSKQKTNAEIGQFKITDTKKIAESISAYKDAAVSYAQGKLSEAKKALELALKHNPNNVKAKELLERVKKEINSAK